DVCLIGKHIEKERKGLARLLPSCVRCCGGVHQFQSKWLRRRRWRWQRGRFRAWWFAAASARTIPRQFCFNSGKSNNVAAKLQEDSGVTHLDLETAMFNHKMDVKNILHEHNMKIIKLENELDVTKARMQTMEQNLKLDIVKSQTTILHSAIAVAGVGIISAMLFNWAGMS
ncbi:hypothetical protein EJB05_48258, partial [Eragrostis curvula]